MLITNSGEDAQIICENLSTDLIQCDMEERHRTVEALLDNAQANTRSPGYGCYCIKYKQWWDSVKLPYNIQAILNLKFAVSNTSNKQNASRRWVEGQWREMIDYKSNRSEILC